MRFHRFMPFFGALVTVVACTGAAASSAPAMKQGNTLQTDVNTLQTAGPTSVIARSDNHGAITTAVAGTAQYGTATPVSVNSHYRTASVTKTFVSATVLQLVGEGRLSLDDTVDRWLPGLITGNGNDGTKISIKQLLQHTSGLFDYTEDSGFLATISSEAAFDANKSHQYSPQDLVNISLSHQPKFVPPGAYYSYSNTNYIVAGLLIKAVTGNTWDIEVTNRIIVPLGLTGTSIPGSVTTLPEPFSHGYNIWTVSPSRKYSDTTEVNPSSLDAAGSIITTAADDAAFFSALLGGRVLPPAQLTQMKTAVVLSAKTGYGLGLAHSKLCQMDLWWHPGQAIGYRTLVLATPDGAVNLAVNTSSTDLFSVDSAFDSGVNNAKDALVRHMFCGANSRSTDSISAQESVIFATTRLGH